MNNFKIIKYSSKHDLVLNIDNISELTYLLMMDPVDLPLIKSNQYCLIKVKVKYTDDHSTKLGNGGQGE